MEATESTYDVVKAHITSLVSALGGVDEEGNYQLGDDALDVLRDIKKWIRFYDQKLNRMDVARCLAEANVVEGDLLPILATWPESDTGVRSKARIALACFELLTPLTWPLEKDAETATVNHYRHLPVLQLAQVSYKRAIIHFDRVPILNAAVRVALPSLATSLGDRSLRDHGILKLVLFFLRNVAMIEPPPGVPSDDADEVQISRSATIDAFAYQDIFAMLLTVASCMGDDFRTEDTALMEVVFHLVKRVDTAKLFLDQVQLQKTNADEITALLKEEQAMIHASHPHPPTRHSRFGTTVWLDRGDGKMSTISGQDALSSGAAREHKMDKSKNFRPPRRARRRTDKPPELKELGGPVALDARANQQLRAFVEDFLDAGFNPLFQHVRKSLDREAPHVLQYHRTQFLYLVAWFLEAERVRQKGRSAKPLPSTGGEEVSSFNLVAGVLQQEMFVFIGRTLDRAYSERDWSELTVVMRCFTQILLTVQSMTESRNEEDEEIAENILSRLFYEEATHDAIANIMKTYKDQGLAYLDACTELTHTYLRILEAYSKQNVDLQVRSRRRTRTKKKKAAAAATAAAAGVDGEQAAAAAAAAQDGNDDDSDRDDEEQAQKTSTERKFDFQRFSMRFAAQGVVDTFVKFIAYYRDLTEAQLRRAHRFLYRVAFKQDMSVMLFRVDILRLLYNMVKGPEALDRHSAAYRDWEELAKHIFRKCIKKMEERPVLIIEMLFSKSASTAHFLEFGYEKQTTSGAAGRARPGAELEFRHIVERDQQIAIAVGALLEKNQSEHIDWVKRQLAMAEQERRSFQMLDVARASLPSDGPATSAAEGGDAPVQPEAASKADTAAILIRPDDDACRKAMFKNSHLRLLMKLVGFQRLVPTLEEEPDSTWCVPASVTADELKESLALIQKAEFSPPVFDNDQSAEDQLKRKAAPRKKAVHDDDMDGDGDEEMLFPAGGPTARKVIDADERKKSQRRRRRQRGEELDGSGGEELGGPTEEELDERARRRRAKELEKARRIKSELYVHASDDETDDEKDRAFFAREEAIRQRVHKSVLAEASAAQATGEKRAKGAKRSKKNTPIVLDDDDDDDDDDDNDDDDDDKNGDSAEKISDDSDAAAAAAQPARRQRKRKKPAASEAGPGRKTKGSKKDTVKKPRLGRQPRRRVAVSDDDEEEEASSDGQDEERDGTRDSTVDTSLSLSPNAAEVEMQEAGGDDDDDLVQPTASKPRPRARFGFLDDSDDE